MNKSITQSALNNLDEILRITEPSYVEWCSAGNDPINHIWYRAARIHAWLEDQECEVAA